jgi:hypothetical protein
MSIRVWRRGGLDDVLVVPEAGRSTRYRSAEPLSAVEVLTRLGELGCHPSDVGEAMSAADPGWMARLAAEADVSEVALAAALPMGGRARLTRGWSAAGLSVPV